MFTRREIERFLFIDVETVRNQAKFDDLDADMQGFWEDKARQYYPDFDTPSSYKKKQDFLPNLTEWYVYPLDISAGLMMVKR